jgi:hypothetical protein
MAAHDQFAHLTLQADGVKTINGKTASVTRQMRYQVYIQFASDALENGRELFRKRDAKKRHAKHTSYLFQWLQRLEIASES